MNGPNLFDTQMDMRAAEPFLTSYLLNPQLALNRLVGIEASRFKSDLPRFAEECLSHLDPSYRIAALLVLASDTVQMCELSVQSFESLALEDEDSVVRGLAILALTDRIDEITQIQLKEIVTQIDRNSVDLNEDLNDSDSDLKSEIREMLEDVHQELEGVYSTPADILGDKAGLNDKAFALECLDASDPHKRLQAITLIRERWGITAHEEAKKCEKLFASDPSLDVRQMAMAALASYHADAKDPRIAELFARVVDNASYSDDFRTNAYIALLKTISRQDIIWKFATDPNYSFQLQDDIDWDLVRAWKKT